LLLATSSLIPPGTSAKRWKRSEEQVRTGEKEGVIGESKERA
jgi:hypothetical protein